MSSKSLRCIVVGSFAICGCSSANSVNVPVDAGSDGETQGSDSSTDVQLPFDAAQDALGDADVLVELIVIQGESNAAGIAHNADATPHELSARPEVQILNNDTLSFEDLHVGQNNELAQHVGDPTIGHGLELGLANEVEAKRLRAPVYLVKCGYPGSGIAEWLPKSPQGYWEMDMPFVDAAIALLNKQGINYRITVWQSIGINDRYNLGTSASDFRSKMDLFKADFRTAYGNKISFLSTNFYNPPPLPYDWKYIFDDMASADPRSFSISVVGATYVDVSTHWDYQGMKLIAHNMVAQMLALP